MTTHITFGLISHSASTIAARSSACTVGRVLLPGPQTGTAAGWASQAALNRLWKPWSLSPLPAGARSKATTPGVLPKVAWHWIRDDPICLH